MKNFIYSNYNLIVDKIYLEKYFFINDEKILIIKSKVDKKIINELINLTNELYLNNINVHTFLLNNKNEYFDKYNGYYVMLLKINDRNRELEINDIIKYNCNLEKYDILSKWKNEVDYIENVIIQYNNEYPLLQSSIDYYIGMAENSIALLSEFKDSLDENYLCHNINIENNSIEEFNNPFCFIKTNYNYDISNYIKIKFYNNNLDYEELYNLLSQNEINSIFLFSCLMYPSQYFRIVKNVISGRCNEKELYKMINNVKKYENFLHYCKNNIKNNKIIQFINWF